MLNICILCQGLPVPAVKGGAIETLVQNILDENEIEKKLKITAIVCEEKQCEELYNSYKMTKFVSGKTYGMIDQSILVRGVRFFIRKVFKKEIYIQAREVISKGYLTQEKIDSFDFIISELSLSTFQYKGTKIPHNKKVYHLHHEGSATTYKDTLFGTLIPVSQFIGDRWVDKTGCSRDKIKVLKNCIDVSLFEKEIEEDEKIKLRRELGISQESYVVLFIGRIICEKGVKELLLALDQISDVEITLLLVGSANFGLHSNTPYEKEIQIIAEKCNIQVVQTGYIDNKNLYQYQNIADLQVIPSICEEAAGLVVLEAQAGGLPVVTTNKGGIPEFLHPDAGIIIDVDKTFVDTLSFEIKKLLFDQERRNKMSVVGKEFSSGFNRKKYYYDFVSLLEGLKD